MFLCPWVAHARSWRSCPEMGLRVYAQLFRPPASVTLALPRCEPHQSVKRTCTVGAILSPETVRRLALSQIPKNILPTLLADSRTPFLPRGHRQEGSAGVHVCVGPCRLRTRPKMDSRNGCQEHKRERGQQAWATMQSRLESRQVS